MSLERAILTRTSWDRADGHSREIGVPTGGKRKGEGIVNGCGIAPGLTLQIAMDRAMQAAPAIYLESKNT